MNKYLLTCLAAVAAVFLPACSSDDDFLSDTEIADLTPISDPQFTVMLGVSRSSNFFGDDNGKSYAYAFHSMEELKKADIRYYFVSADGDFSLESLVENESLVEKYGGLDWDKQTLVIVCQWFPAQYPIIKLNSGKIYSKKGNFYVDLDLEYGGSGLAQALCVCGVSFVVDAPNISVKNIKLKASGNTFIPWYKKDEITPVPFKKIYTY